MFIIVHGVKNQVKSHAKVSSKDTGTAEKQTEIVPFKYFWPKYYIKKYLWRLVVM